MVHPALSSPSAYSLSGDLRGAQDQIPDAASLGVQLALAPQLRTPRAAQIAVGARQAVEADVHHILAGLLRTKGLIEIRAALSLSTPDAAEHFEGLIRLTTHSLGTFRPTAVLSLTLFPAAGSGDIGLSVLLSAAPRWVLTWALIWMPTIQFAGNAPSQWS
jgi:hypothetical protein